MLRLLAVGRPVARRRLTLTTVAALAMTAVVGLGAPTPASASTNGLNKSWQHTLYCGSAACGSVRQAFGETLTRISPNSSRPNEIDLTGSTYAYWKQTNGFVPYSVCIEDVWWIYASAYLAQTAVYDVSNFHPALNPGQWVVGNYAYLSYGSQSQRVSFCTRGGTTVRNPAPGAGNYTIQASTINRYIKTATHRQTMSVYFYSTSTSPDFTHSIQDTHTFG